MYANRGEPVDLNALNGYITAEMAEYNKQLQNMIHDNESGKSLGKISESDRLKIKQIYRKIAKQFHPDIFPQQPKPISCASSGTVSSVLITATT